MTTPPEDPRSSADAILSTIRRWQAGALAREQVVLELSRVPLEQGNVIQDVLSALQGHMELARATSAEHVQEDTQSWRSELMASRARNWTSPYPVGLLVCPSVLILTEATRGVVLRESGAKALPRSTSASIMLLCQTIVMAQNAVDAQELKKLQDQRIASTSTSLSEIEIIR
ncbi:hypothetical protein D3875_22425 [Deinococcus cavernae]|uniref:Uncharacterized protein n=1 Tax=Deinococcus cavernae TaxID=2320857 RepID=A0A418V053_9DEIO|nr:hypothetical protein [Deinococcus cavernae]RJF69080.1 hypothetical protein D3875_22425 [Deinococcus cavernae]